MPTAPTLPSWIQNVLQGNAAFGAPKASTGGGGAPAPAGGTGSPTFSNTVGGTAPGAMPGYGAGGMSPFGIGGPLAAPGMNTGNYGTGTGGNIWLGTGPPPPGYVRPGGAAGAAPPGAPPPGQGNTGPTGTIFPPSGTAADAASQGQQLGQQTAAGQLPGYSGDLASIGQNISAETAGVLPPDVIQQIEQAGAERGVATGSPGSDNSNAAMLRALGLTSLNLTEEGQKNFQSMLPSLPGYNLSQNPAFYTTPGENLQAGTAGANLQNQKNEFKAAQDAQAEALRQAQAGVAAGLGMGGSGGGGVTLPGAARPGTDAFGFPIDNTPFNPFGGGNPAAVGNPYALGTTPQGGNLMTDSPIPGTQPGAAGPMGGAPAGMSDADYQALLDAISGGGGQVDPLTGLLDMSGGGSSDPANVDYSYAGAG
jgi:hypothetical protein